MKNKLLFVLFLFIATNTLAQKNYSIDHVSCKYKKPKHYTYRIDNFNLDEKVQAGENLPDKNTSDVKAEKEEKILYSIVKSETSEINKITASCRQNVLIKNHTLKGYAEMLAASIKAGFDGLGPKQNLTMGEIEIDKNSFYLIEYHVLNDKKEFDYGVLIFCGGIAEKQLTIAASYDNAKDKKAIFNSITKSKFDKKN